MTKSDDQIAPSTFFTAGSFAGIKSMQPPGGFSSISFGNNYTASPSRGSSGAYGNASILSAGYGNNAYSSPSAYQQVKTSMVVLYAGSACVDCLHDGAHDHDCRSSDRAIAWLRHHPQCLC